MGACGCKNSRTGDNKKRYATKAQAELACEESRKVFTDGDTLNTYYCREGLCWHVGNKRFTEVSLKPSYPSVSAIPSHSWQPASVRTQASGHLKEGQIPTAIPQPAVEDERGEKDTNAEGWELVKDTAVFVGVVSVALVAYPVLYGIKATLDVVSGVRGLVKRLTR
jgi:hypothetical protein